MFFLFKCLCLSTLFLKCINEGIGSFVEKKIQFVSFYILSSSRPVSEFSKILWTDPDSIFLKSDLEHWWLKIRLLN